MSFRAAAYRAGGGSAPVCHDEDGVLVEAFRANAKPIIWAADLPVITSARRNARAPKGFASYLSSLEEATADHADRDAVGGSPLGITTST